METVKKTPQVNKRELEDQIKAVYTHVATDPNASYHFETGGELALELGYPSEYIDRIPEPSLASFAGVGYHFDLADLRQGERVLDLGSGSGTDVFYARQAIGPSGMAYGLEMTDAQLNKAENIRNSGQYRNVRFLKGYIEEIPMTDAAMDVVISNGVINLSSEKWKVFQEAYRVLRDGGRLAISDIVGTRSFPTEITCNPSLWAACVAGAVPREEYLDLIRSAGFRILGLKSNDYSFVSERALSTTKNYGIFSISVLAVKEGAS
ncbi:methyltransferase domain-containing protein [Robiginitalea sp. SC105]|uniref:methyltransferase domain-containing protein n=1 Tax=Robiginitalea sp. SC105 TaxID=2762332 RepID=UPI00163974AF|nr:methyltransferase domain-containing protein [Robiginitalea sp. SC105]MBC2838623.1 methyltransferase domain-containing protein [Robiginitalea sp. SC105]